MIEAQWIDAELRSIATQRQQLHAREAALLSRAEELRVWQLFGCASLLDYLERRCDLHPRTAKEHVRVARALQELPLMRGELEAGRVVYSTVRELSRVATAATEVAWLREAAGMSPREVEEAVAGRKRGDHPRDPRDPDRTVKLVLEVRMSTYAQFVEARTRLANERGESLNDDEIVLALCRTTASPATARAISRPTEHGADDPLSAEADGIATVDKPPYQLAISTCRQCAKSFQVGGGLEVEVSAATVERARCDAHHLGDVEAETPSRVVASVTPRMRRHVMTRDRFQCRVPGCRSKRNLDVHHIVFQSRRGSHKASNLITLCSGHHQQLHDGMLIVSGKAPHGVVFEWPSDSKRTSTRSTGSQLHPVSPVSGATLEDVERAAAAALESMPTLG